MLTQIVVVFTIHSDGHNRCSVKDRFENEEERRLCLILTFKRLRLILSNVGPKPLDLGWGRYAKGCSVIKRRCTLCLPYCRLIMPIYK